MNGLSVDKGLDQQNRNLNGNALMRDWFSRSSDRKSRKPELFQPTLKSVLIPEDR